MDETHDQLGEDLRGLEGRTMDGLDLVVEQLDRALESIGRHDVKLAATVVADDGPVDRVYLEVNQGILGLLAIQAPIGVDVRLVAALLHMIRCVERIGDQCVNIAKLVALSSYDGSKDPQILNAIDRMGRLARDQVTDAKRAFVTRQTPLARDLIGRDLTIDRMNREIFNRAVEIGNHVETREWAMLMILVARCLEKIGDNAVGIAEQTIFIITGRLHDLADR